MAKRQKKEVTKITAEDAMVLAAIMDLPDGAYWAMVEELSGCDAADCVSYEEEEE